MDESTNRISDAHANLARTIMTQHFVPNKQKALDLLWEVGDLLGVPVTNEDEDESQPEDVAQRYGRQAHAVGLGESSVGPTLFNVRMSVIAAENLQRNCDTLGVLSHILGTSTQQSVREVALAAVARLGELVEVQVAKRQDESSPDSTFRIGDTVQLKAGFESMMIEGIDGDNVACVRHNPPYVFCKTDDLYHVVPASC